MKGSKLYAWKNEALKISYEEMTKHYKKANFEVKSYGTLCFGFEKVLAYHLSLVKCSSYKGKEIDMNTTIPIWSKDSERENQKRARTTFSIS